MVHGCGFLLQKREMTPPKSEAISMVQYKKPLKAF